MYVLNGKPFKKNKKVNAKIYDIIPTIFHVLKIPITEEIDGKIISRALVTKASKKKKGTKKENIADLIEQSFALLDK